MPKGIFVYAEHFAGKIEPSVRELLTAAEKISKITGEKIAAFTVAENHEEITEELIKAGFDEIHIVPSDKNLLLSDDTISDAAAFILRENNPSAVLIPATPEGRSVFSRVGIKLNCGLTADVTDVDCDKDEEGDFYIKQTKPSFGENIFVTIVTKKTNYPQMLTIRQGVFNESERKAENPVVKIYEGYNLKESGLKIVSSKPTEVKKDSIVSADTVVVSGRGALEGNNLELCKRFAGKINGVMGCTRPMVDCELVPFENQIGQTGVTVRPKICVSLGVSGAIQHTEGIKDTKLYIAINKDENASVFNGADYGIVGDIKEILEAYLAI